MIPFDITLLGLPFLRKYRPTFLNLMGKLGMTPPTISPHTICGVSPIYFWMTLLNYGYSLILSLAMWLSGSLNYRMHPFMTSNHWRLHFWHIWSFSSGTKRASNFLPHWGKILPPTSKMIFMSGDNREGWLKPQFPMLFWHIGLQNHYFPRFHVMLQCQERWSKRMLLGMPNT